MDKKTVPDQTFVLDIKVFSGLEDAITFLTGALRTFFATDPLAKDKGYWHSADETMTQIVIRSIFDPRPDFYPQITVGLGAFSVKLAGFGAFQGQWDDEETGESFEQLGGFGTGGITLELRSKEHKPRIQISDLLLTGLALNWDKLSQVGIDTSGDPRFDGFAEEPYLPEPARKLHIARFSLPYLYNWSSSRRLTAPVVEGVNVRAHPVANYALQNPAEAFNAGFYTESEEE